MNGGKGFPCAFRVKVAIRILCSAVSILGLPERAEASTITNYLRSPWLQNNIAVDVGDTVVWVNRWPAQFTNDVESFGGEWKSPPMNSGEAFSFTFTNAGFYAYRARWGSWGFSPDYGAVTVVGWTDAPPAITINTPAQGTFAFAGAILVQATATNTSDLAEIQLFLDSALIGAATNSPYQAWWINPQAGQHVLLAKAVDRQGRIPWSRPVNVNGSDLYTIWGTRRLPTGEILFFYNSMSTSDESYLVASDRPAFGTFTTNYTTLRPADFPAIFVDESARDRTLQRRFYTIIPGRFAP